MLKTIKVYFSSWDTARIIKMVAGIALSIAYFSNKEVMYLFGSLFFVVQALFNIGCPGGTCSTNIPKDEEKGIKIDKYEPNKK